MALDHVVDVGVRGRGIQPTRGKLYDHIGISVPKLEPALAALRKAGVKVTLGPKTWAKGQIRSAFVEGPDRLAIELVEDHSAHPPVTE